ncbi:MAG: hypothetical protein M0P12_01250 [Paludibacteraceae bacterium]|nr:hypothetical protein [Paludibacteraceae bacterium]
MEILYKLIRHKYGWLVCAADGQDGVPPSSLQECLPLFGKKSVLDAGIVHHYNVCDNSFGHVVFAITSDSKAWRKEIEDSLSALHPTTRWWYGTDVGKSSAVIFSVLSLKTGYSGQAEVAKEFGEGCVPLDSDDLGRCLRLLERFPDWKKDLYKVSEAYPNTAWPKIVERWQELKTADSNRQNEILIEINESR